MGIGYFSGGLANPSHMYFAAPLMMVPATYPVFQPPVPGVSFKPTTSRSREDPTNFGFDGTSQRSTETPTDSCESDQQQDLEDPFTEPDQGDFKRPVYSRRVQSKSEPVGSDGIEISE